MEDGRPVPLPPKPFETLYYLASRPGRVISKTELIDALWPGTFVTEDVLVQCVVDIRRALKDQARSPRYVQTIPRRGYQFLAPVTPLGSSSEVPGPAPAARRRHGRPSARWAVAAGFALLMAAGILRLSRRGPDRGIETAEAVAPVESGSLVVMPIDVEEPAPENGWLRQGLAEMIRSSLGQTPGVHMVPRQRLVTALAAAGYREDQALSVERATEVARRLRAEQLVTGSYVRVAGDFVLTARVTSLATGRVAGTATVRGRHPGDILDAVEGLCLKLLPYVSPAAGIERGALGPGFHPTRLSTRSLEASRHYVEALASFARGGQTGTESAERELNAALALDPSFAQAYVMKARVQLFRSQWGYGTADPKPAIEAASRLSHDLPHREQLMVASFRALVIDDKPAEALRHWNALLQFYPTWAEEVGVAGLVIQTFQHLGRWDDLILVAEAHLESPSLPDSERALLSAGLAQAFRRKGEFAEARVHARRAVRLWPNRAGPEFLRQRTTLGRISLEAGRREEALEEFRGVATSPAADVTNLTDAAWGFYMAGEVDEAWALAARARELDPSYGNAYHLTGWIQLARGQYPQAARSLETAFERTPGAFGFPHQGMVGGDIAALYYSGVADQKAGQRESATRSLERVMRLCRDVLAQRRDAEDEALRWQAASFLARAAARLGRPAPEPPRLHGDDTTYFVQSARLHAVEGRRELALRELAQGLALGHGEFRHILDDPDFESIRGDPSFERLVVEPTRLASARDGA